MPKETLACPLPAYALPRAAEVDTRTLARPAGDARAMWPRRILVASDASSASDAAIVATRILAERSGASVEMAAVYSPRIPLPASPERRGFEQCEMPERSEAAALLRAVRKQRRRSVPERSDWPLRLGVGDVGTMIVRLANAAASDLVVLGVGERDLAVYAGHTAACVARYLETPLLAVVPGCEAPSRCVVALPDGRTHAATLRAAVGCLPSGAHVWIVVPNESSTQTPDRVRSESAHELVARACEPELAGHVDALDLVRVDVAGEMLAGILRVINDVNAQLIAVPNRGEPGAVRAFLENLAEPLLLATRCSVLIVPDERAAAA
jgi:nucleotide-binding universal stress UspA family protein